MCYNIFFFPSPLLFTLFSDLFIHISVSVKVFAWVHFTYVLESVLSRKLGVFQHGPALFFFCTRRMRFLLYLVPFWVRGCGQLGVSQQEVLHQLPLKYIFPLIYQDWWHDGKDPHRDGPFPPSQRPHGSIWQDMMSSARQQTFPSLEQSLTLVWLKYVLDSLRYDVLKKEKKKKSLPAAFLTAASGQRYFSKAGTYF